MAPTASRGPRIFVVGLALAGLLSAPVAHARNITPDLKKAIELVREHGSEVEARALEKLLQIEGQKDIPLAKAFIDGSIGRDSAELLERQIERLTNLRPGRPYLDKIIGQLKAAHGGLDRHGYLGWGTTNTSHPSDELVLDGHRPDADRLRSNAARFAKAVAAGDTAAIAELVRSHFKGSLEVTSDADGNLIATLHGSTPSSVVLAAQLGADHAGASVAALLEAGQALAGQRFEKTIRLVFMKQGSAADAARQARALVGRLGGNAPLEAVFVLGDVSHNPGARASMTLHTSRDERSLYLGSEITRAADRLGGGLSSTGVLTGAAPAGGLSFMQKGVPTVIVAHDEQRGESAPDFAHAGKVVGATVEAIARVARPRSLAVKPAAGSFAPGTVFGDLVHKGMPKQNQGSVGRNEMFDERGHVRAPYAPVAAALVAQSKAANDNAAREMHLSSSDESKYRAYPRVVSQGEFGKVERGLGQLERLMQAVLKDVYSKDSKLLASGLLTKDDLAVAEDFVPEYVGRYGQKTTFDLLVRPDLVRNAKGEWTLLEINQGFLGGLSGIRSTRELLKQANPKAFDGVRVHAVEDFLVDFAKNLKAMAKPGGKVVYANFGYVNHKEDSEDKYLGDELGKEGIEYVSSYTAKKLQTVRGKVYLVSPDGTKERVDVVYSRKGGGPEELVEAHVNGGVRLFPSPGSGVLESKHLYKKLPMLIRALLKEEPVFSFIKTQSFAKGGKLDAAFLDEVMKNPDKWVMKAANDAAGAGVLVGMGASKAKLAEFKARILAQPEAWDAQEFTAPETLNGERVDFDPYMISTKGKVLIPKSAMVRSAKMDKRFSDNPRFLDAWVRDESRPRDYLAQKPARPVATAPRKLRAQVAR